MRNSSVRLLPCALFLFLCLSRQVAKGANRAARGGGPVKDRAPPGWPSNERGSVKGCSGASNILFVCAAALAFCNEMADVLTLCI